VDIHQEAQRLIRVYQVLKIQYGHKQAYFTTIDTGTSQYGCFLKLVTEIAVWKGKGLDVDATDYLRAHFEFYKGAKQFYPSHLLTSYSFKIYLQYMKSKIAKDTMETVQQNVQAEQEMLERLSRSRKQTIAEVLLETYQGNLFTKKFLLQNKSFLNLIENGQVQEENINRK